MTSRAWERAEQSTGPERTKDQSSVCSSKGKREKDLEIRATTTKLQVGFGWGAKANPVTEQMSKNYTTTIFTLIV